MIRGPAIITGALLALQLLLPSGAASGDQLPPASQTPVPGPDVTRSQAESPTLPARAVIRTFLEPEEDGVLMLARIPLDVLGHLELPIEGPGYLVLEGIEPYLLEAGRVWADEHVAIYAGGRRLEDPHVAHARVSLPSDRSFDAYESALEHLRGPALPSTTELFWRQGLLDLQIEYLAPGGVSGLAVRPEWHELARQTVGELTFLQADGTVRHVRFTDDPGRIRLDPGLLQVAGQFVGRGFSQTFLTLEALLLLVLLVAPLRRMIPIVSMLVSFAAAHTITVVAGATGMAPGALWFPPLIAMLAAATVVYVGFENIIGSRFGRRWPVAFAFGLVHGFAFWFPLEESLQFAGSHPLTALAAFNAGIVLALGLAVAIAVPLVELIFRRVVAERVGIILLSALLAHSAWHWMLDRGAALREYQFQFPVVDLAFAAGVMRWLMLALVSLGAAWLLLGIFARLPGWEEEQTRGFPESGSGATADSAG